MAVDASNDVFLANYGTANSDILKITPSGNVSVYAGRPGTTGAVDGVSSVATFNEPTGITIDKNGTVFVADWSNNTIRMITTDGYVSTIGGLAGQTGSNGGTNSQARFNSPKFITVNSAGSLYVSDSGNRRICVGTPVVPTPVLGLSSIGNQYALFWPASFSNYVVQVSTSLAIPNWTTVTNGASLTGLMVTNPGTASFYRLIQQ